MRQITKDDPISRRLGREVGATSIDGAEHLTQRELRLGGDLVEVGVHSWSIAIGLDDSLIRGYVKRVRGGNDESRAYMLIDSCAHMLYRSGKEATMKRVPVSPRALVQRINRKLKADGEVLKTTRSDRWSAEL